MAHTKRLDIALFEQGFAESRSKAQGMIETGCVYVNGKLCQKCSFAVYETDALAVRGEASRFVGRGGHKLLKALDTFQIDLQQKICMDIGASTGGFTDCMLQHGAQKVYAVDVGTDQLAESLRNDPRVVNVEHYNFRYATPDDFSEPMDFASVDVSFISLEKILPPLLAVLTNCGQAVCLIKPQFEAGKEHLGKHGVIRNREVHQQVICRVIQNSIRLGFTVLGLTYSPIKGAQGNVEYLLYLGADGSQEMTVLTQPYIKNIVNQAFKELSDK